MIPRGGGGGGPGFDPRVFFQLGWITFFLLRVEYFFFSSELHVHFAGCHILLLVQYCVCVLL